MAAEECKYLHSSRDSQNRIAAIQHTCPPAVALHLLYKQMHDGARRKCADGEQQKSLQPGRSLMMEVARAVRNTNRDTPTQLHSPALSDRAHPDCANPDGDADRHIQSTRLAWCSQLQDGPSDHSDGIVCQGRIEHDDLGDCTHCTPFPHR